MLQPEPVDTLTQTRAGQETVEGALQRVDFIGGGRVELPQTLAGHGVVARGQWVITDCRYHTQGSGRGITSSI